MSGAKNACPSLMRAKCKFMFKLLQNSNNNKCQVYQTTATTFIFATKNVQVCVFDCYRIICGSVSVARSVNFGGLFAKSWGINIVIEVIA